VRENSSAAFGKVAVGNELSGNAFFGSDVLRNYRGPGRLVGGLAFPKAHSKKGISTPPITSTANV